MRKLRVLYPQHKGARKTHTQRDCLNSWIKKTTNNNYNNNMMSIVKRGHKIVFYIDVSVTFLNEGLMSSIQAKQRVQKIFNTSFKTCEFLLFYFL